MGKDPWYLTVGKTPLERVHQLLSKLDSIRRSKERGSVVLDAEKDLSHKFMGQVEFIFKNLPKPLKWQYFLMHDLILLTDIPSKVQKASVKHSLNKAQTKALARLEQVSDKFFQDVTQKDSIKLKDQNNHLLPKLELNEFSAREIQAFAEDIEKTNIKNQQKTDQERFKALNWGLRAWDMAFLNADFRDFQGIPAVYENPDNAILMFTYAKLLETCGRMSCDSGCGSYS